MIMVVIFVLAGIRSSTGNSVLGPLGDTFAAAWRSFRNTLLTPRQVAGNAWAAFFVGLALFALTVIFVPTVRAGRHMVIAGVVCAMFGFVFYQPSLVGAG